METAPFQAVIRFGLGRRGAEPLPEDARGWLKAQLDGPDSFKPVELLPTGADGLILLREQNRLHLPVMQLALQADLKAQTAALLTTDVPFRERLVWFWANHFSVSTRQGEVTALAGPFIREAIRPHVTGTFFEMLVAVMRHPAMLLYLDNGSSTGPNSPAGLRTHRGLNENLARECLELHTVGLEAGYTQEDVTAFAAVLTGWAVDQNSNPPSFAFRPENHEPGEKTILGQTFPPGDVGGILALEFLAHHKATYRHLATKLVRHFVADAPPPEAVEVIEHRLRDTHGDLQAACLALVDLPQAWTPLAKFRSPFDYAVACLRALDLPLQKKPPPPDLAAAFNALAEPAWNAPLPNGWPDDAAGWVAPEAVLRRIDWAYAIAAHAAEKDPPAVAEAALGPLLHPATSAAMRNAGSRRDALTLLLTAPEFFRR